MSASAASNGVHGFKGFPVNKEKEEHVSVAASDIAFSANSNRIPTCVIIRVLIVKPACFFGVHGKD